MTTTQDLLMTICRSNGGPQRKDGPMPVQPIRHPEYRDPAAVTHRSESPLYRECDDCHAAPGEPCHPGCSSEWTDDDDATTVDADEPVGTAW